MSTQTDRIIEKFGTQEFLANAIGVGQPAVAAWKKRGFIPAKRHDEVLTAARRLGIDLRPADFFAAADEADADTPEREATE